MPGKDHYHQPDSRPLCAFRGRDCRFGIRGGEVTQDLNIPLLWVMIGEAKKE